MFFRKNNKLISLGLFVILSLFVSSNLNLIFSGVYAQVSDENTAFSFDYIERGSISIIGDTDVDLDPLNGIVTGNGSESDPYVIENYKIENTNPIGIYIQDTSVSFIIRNCYIDAENWGIYILGTYSGKLTIYNNVIVNHDSEGILIYRYPGCEMFNNTVQYNHQDGIDVHDSNYSSIYNNTCKSNLASGISTSTSVNLLIENNICNYNNWGISTWFGENSIVKDNYCYSNIFDGIRVISGVNISIISNEVLATSIYGISLESDSINNTIHHNDIIDNGGTSSQGFDEGTGNIWYDNITFEGNLWSDWTGGYYYIDGSAGSYDMYPFVNLDNLDFIQIHSDVGFETLNLEGDGTEMQPYILEDLVIDTNNLIGISVKGTTKHFIIQNCTISSSGTGISLINLLNGTATIHNNSLINNDDYGIYLDNASSSLISQNYCNNSFYGGIHVQYSNSCEILSNFCEEMYWEGITALFTDGNTIIGDNICRNCSTGILVFYSSEVSISNNTNYYNRHDGIEIWRSTNSTLYGNNCSFSSTGIRFTESNQSLINYNYLTQNHCGLYLSIGSYSNIIHHNHLVYNTAFQARDEGTGNVWYDITTSEGNWWSDWTGGEYLIIGLAGSVDPFPLGTPVISEFLASYGFILLFTQLSMVMVILWIKKRR